jgi:transposase InsO family protein
MDKDKQEQRSEENILEDKVEKEGQSSTVVRRGAPRCPGVYVQGSIQDIEVWYTVDTGASRTIVSDRIFKKISNKDPVMLSRKNGVPLEQADGNPLKDYGSIEVELHIGPLRIKKEVVVADIKDDVLLGMDIGEPFDVLTSSKKIVINGQEVPCVHVKSCNVRKVYSAEMVIIPEFSEVILEAIVESENSDEDQTEDVIIEPASNFTERFKLLMASSLTTIGQSHTGKVRVMNPGRNPVRIQKNTVIGQAEPFNSEGELLLIEDEEETSNMESVRRLKCVSEQKQNSLEQFEKENNSRTSCDESPPDTCKIDFEVQRTKAQFEPRPGNTLRFGKVTKELGIDTLQKSGIRVVKKPTQNGDQSQRQPVREVEDNGSNEEADKDVSAELKHSLPIHLREMFAKAARDRNLQEQQALYDLLMEYKDTFSEDDNDLGCTQITEHAIDTGNATPIKQAPRRVPMALAHEEKKAIEQMMAQGVITPSSSPWASPIVLVKKKNGKIRPCVDYRKLNDLTKKDAYPLPRTQECLDAMSGSVIFSTLDMTSGYYQVPVKEQDRAKTAFVTKHGLFEFKTMPFGLTNAPATFQRIMELALRGLQWTTCLIYLDDVIIFGSSFEQHLERLKDVLKRVQEANLKLKPEKCELMQAEVPFLGHIVSSDGVRPNPDNLAKIMQWKEPETVTEVRQFLGLCSYYRRFVKDFSTTVKPLTDLTKKESKLVWTQACQDAFDKLRGKLTGPEIMAYPQEGQSFILDTDASDFGIGAVISQVQDGQEKVIAYASRTLNKAERNYCVTDKELLAIKHFVEYFRHYLLGQAFLVRTDHQALIWLFSLREPKGRISRWIEILSAYNFSIEYRPGKRHGNADGLSRCPNPRDCQCSEEDNLEALKCGPCKKCRKRADDMQTSWNTELVREVKGCQKQTKGGRGSICNILAQGGRGSICTIIAQVIMTILTWLPMLLGICTQERQPVCDRQCKSMINRGCAFQTARTRTDTKNQEFQTWALGRTMKELRELQEKDPSIGPLLRWKQEDKRPFGPDICSASPEVRHYWNYWKSLELQNGLLFKQFHCQDGSTSYQQFLVPKKIRKEVLHQMHDAILSGHLGKGKTTAKILQRYYWYELRQDVGDWIRKCDNCAANKPPSKNPKAPMGDMRVGAPMDRLSTDVLGPLPLTSRGNRYIVVVIDHFTRWVEIFPTSDQTAETTANVILNGVISRFGCPLDLHSDQGRNYESTIFKELCRLLEIRKTRTSPRHPQANGQAERFNRTLIKMIRAYLKGEQRDWDLNLGCLTAAYRATVNESTGFTPNMLMLGKEVRMPGEVIYGTKDQPLTSYGAYIDNLRSHFQKAHMLARKHQDNSTKRQKDTFDGKTLLNKYQPGDLVWYLAEVRKEGICPKLQNPYRGPCVITKKLNDLDYGIQLDVKGTERVVHHNKLKPYEGDTELPWARRAMRKHRKCCKDK